MARTTIEWATDVWNPVRGCSRVSEGCRHCYAERMAARGLPSMNSPTTGDAFAIMRNGDPHWTGKVELIESKLEEPLHWRKPRRVFVNSMSDLYHESLPDRARDRIHAVMALCPQHDFLVLTKRSREMREYFTMRRREIKIQEAVELRVGVGDGAEELLEQVLDRDWRWPFQNLWLGVSCENPATAKERISVLFETPAAARWVSLEPLLAGIDLGDYLGHHLGCDGETYPCSICGSKGRLDWVVDGGETGPGARPTPPEHFRANRDACVAAGVPYFHKQNGGWAPTFKNDTSHGRYPKFVDAPVGDGTHHRVFRVGKKTAGRLLDGQIWEQFPEVRG